MSLAARIAGSVLIFTIGLLAYNLNHLYL